MSAGSGPASKDITCGDADQAMGVPNGPSCLQPACSSAKPTTTPVAVTPNNARSRPAGVAALLTGGAQSADAAASSSAAPASIGASVNGALPTSRVIVNRNIAFTWHAPANGKEAKNNASMLDLGQEFLAEAFGGEYQGIVLTPHRGILSGMRLEITNNCDYEVNAHIPGYVDAETTSAGSGHQGAVHLFPGEKKEVDLLADEAVVEDQSITSLQTFTPAQLGKCEEVNTRGAWKAYAKMTIGGQVIVNPVLEEMYAANVIDQAHWTKITEAAPDAEVSNIDKDAYDSYKSRLISHASAIDNRLADLTSMKFLFARADGKDFGQMPTRIANQTGKHGEEAKAKFRNVPGSVNCVLSVEYASDAVGPSA